MVKARVRVRVGGRAGARARVRVRVRATSARGTRLAGLDDCGAEGRDHGGQLGGTLRPPLLLHAGLGRGVHACGACAVSVHAVRMRCRRRRALQAVGCGMQAAGFRLQAASSPARRGRPWQ